MRKILIILFSAVALLTAATAQSDDKVYIDLSAPAEKKLPIAVQEFVEFTPSASSASIKKELADALKSDLKFSNLFTIIKSETAAAGAAGLTLKEINFSKWRASGADTLITGGFSLTKDSIIFEIRLYDCINEKMILGKRYTGPAKAPRMLVHYFADQIYESLTGRKGIFSTKILFVSDRTGAKEIYASDYDGRGVIQITNNKSINLSPQWAADGTRIIYTSYKRGTPALYMLDLKTGKETLVSGRPGINIGGRFSPDGKKIALTISNEKSPELAVLDMAKGSYDLKTSNYGIDVSPSWSPDGRNITYVTDISGNPHIFMINLESGKTQRLTFEGKYNSSPALSPDGKLIAYSRSDGGKFNIWVMNADGTNPTQLTFEGNNRSPSWSPDGRYIVFNSVANANSSLYIMRSNGEGLMKLNTNGSRESDKNINDRTPAWSPFLQQQ